MLRHWHEAKYLLKVLTWRVLGYDKDGIELYFTNPDTRARVLPSDLQNIDEFINAMDEARPYADGQPHLTDIVPALETILTRHAKDESRNSTLETRKKTIIVLTDGIWGGSTDEGVNEFFKYQLQRLCQSHIKSRKRKSSSAASIQEDLEASRPVTFQFVRFGFNKKACQRLIELDDGLKAQSGM
jgi:hypothetical protein